ncbi:uncharacterized protein [Littorina saxatilis]|uniref:uncharacterized protein n=1 Tax=Littorina saxatilis TaxID=31220 RepID=UPI0038B60A05
MDPSLCFVPSESVLVDSVLCQVRVFLSIVFCSVLVDSVLCQVRVFLSIVFCAK